MLLITRQSLANDAARRWRLQYPSEQCPDKQLQLRDLIKLGSNCDPDQIDRIAGNGSWTRTVCHECDTIGVPVVELGQAIDYDSMTASICKRCLTKALDLFGK